MKSILPALAAVLLVALGGPSANAATTRTGGFSSEPPPTEAPLAEAAMNSDRRTAVAPADAPPQVVAAIEAANRITRKPYKWAGGHGRWSDSGTTAPAPSPTSCTPPACSRSRATRPV